MVKRYDSIKCNIKVNIGNMLRVKSILYFLGNSTFLKVRNFVVFIIKMRFILKL